MVGSLSNQLVLHWALTPLCTGVCSVGTGELVVAVGVVVGDDVLVVLIGLVGPLP